MRRITLTLALLALVVGVAMRWRRVGTENLFTPGLKSEPDSTDLSVPPIDWANASGFAFTWGDGSGLMGYDVTKVNSSGMASYTFADRSGGGFTWKQATFQLDPATFAALKALLDDEGYLSLAKAYYAPVCDGTQRFVKVEIAGRRKGVFCSNYFPPQIERIKSFVDGTLLANQRPAIASATDVTATYQMELETFDPPAMTRPASSKTH